MKLGFCRTAITPPIGIELAGYASRIQPSIGILDDLYARCIALEYGNLVLAIAVLDILGIPRDLWREIATAIRKFTGIPEDNVLIIATHTHSGPSISSNKVYREYLVHAVAGCIMCAYNNMEEIKAISIARRYVPDLVYNRRRPRDGAIDPELQILVFRSRYSVALVNYTCHPVVLGPTNRRISADFPGALVKYLEILSDIDRAIYVNGCAGDINPYTPSTDFSRPYDRRRGTYEEVLSFGYVLALEATRAIMNPNEISSIDVIEYGYRDVALKLRKVDLDLLRIDRLIKEAEERKDLYSLWKLRRIREIALAYGSRDHLEYRIAALRIGKKLAMVFMPAEVFVEHQLYIKKLSPAEHTVVVAYANSYDGYIPTAEAFDEGGYEADYPVSIIERGEGEKLRDSVLELLNELFR